MAEQLKNEEVFVHDPENILEIRNLKKYFPIKGALGTKKGAVKAVDDVTFSIKKGTTMGLVGESGCGKSTTGRTILRLIEKTDGEVYFDGVDVNKLSKKELRALRTARRLLPGKFRKCPYGPSCPCLGTWHNRRGWAP